MMNDPPLVFRAGDVTLSSGGRLPDARLVYRTYGTLSAERDNVVLFPTWFAGRDLDATWIVGPGKSLDTDRWFVIIVNLLGNGLSSSPSNTPPPFDGPRFPHVSLLDNVDLQRRLLTEVFGVEVLALVLGRSMGAQVAFQWAAWHPQSVPRLLALVGSARTSPHNRLFLETVRDAIVSDSNWWSARKPGSAPEALARVQRLFDAWGYSQSFFRIGLQRELGFEDLESFQTRKPGLLHHDLDDLLAQVCSWQLADISDNDRFGRDLRSALGAITARAVVMPCRTDLYFPPEDSMIEVAAMPDAELRVIESVWGHRAGAPGTARADVLFLECAIRDLLAA